MSAHRDAGESVAFGPFRLDSKRRVLTAGGREVALQPRAFDLLALFLGCRGQVLSNDEIIGHVWRGVAVGDNNLGVQLSALRRVLAEHGGKGLIVTVPGRGYRFVGEVVSALPDLPLPPQAVAEVRPAHARRLAIGLGIAAMLTLTAGVAILVRRPPATVPSLSFNPPPHSVAVLAFANTSGDPSQEYFSDGLSEELIDLLSRVPALRVAGRTSSFSFKSKPATIAEIARTLNVGAVLEGSVRRQGNRLRITAALNDARTGYQFWAQDFDRDQADIFALQTDIASAVTEALQMTLLGADAAKLGQGGTNDPGAFDAYLQGVRALRQNTIDTYHTAIARFDAAIKRDPGFALAYSGRADAVAYLAMIGPGFSPDDVHRMFADALVSADRGVALAPDIGATHAARGFVLSNGLLDYARGFAELTRARTAAPGNATIQMIYAGVAIAVGHSKDAVAAAQKAVELDPLRQDAWGCLAYIMYQARRYAEALDAMQHARAVAPAFPPQFVMGVGMNLFMQGKPGAARDMCETSPSWEGWYCLAFADHALHRNADAASDLAKLRAALGDTGAYNYATIYAQWGQPAVALTWLKRAAELKDSGLAEMATEPLLDPIRDQSDFRAIARAQSAPKR